MCLKVVTDNKFFRRCLTSFDHLMQRYEKLSELWYYVIFGMTQLVFERITHKRAKSKSFFGHRSTW